MFEGFSEKTIDFLWGIRLNNNRAWFEEHKKEYQQDLYAPFRALGEQVFALLQERFPEMDIHLKVTRIYRDARRLHGRDPYKDHLWFTIERPLPLEEWVGEPVFWFELEPSQFTYGMGYYSPKALTMEKFRKRLDTNPKQFLKLVKLLDKQERFVLETQLYKRPKKADVPPKLFDWYNCKNLSITHRQPNDETLYQPELAQTLADAYSELMPFYQYFSTIHADPDPREPISAT